MSDSRDDIIREALAKRAQGIVPSENMLDDIYRRAGQNKREVFGMKGSYKKIIAVVCAVVVVGTTGVLAGGLRKSATSHSDRREAIEHFPTAEEVEKAVGYVPKYLEELPGGYKFESAQPSDRTDKDADGNVIKEARDISFYYDTGIDGAILNLGTEEGNYIDDTDNCERVDIGGVEAHYTSFTYMAVPPDYKPTEEEIQREKEGTLQIGYGSSELTITQTSSVMWFSDGITYNLLSMGTSADREEMLEMAEAIINS